MRTPLLAEVNVAESPRPPLCRRGAAAEAAADALGAELELLVVVGRRATSARGGGRRRAVGAARRRGARALACAHAACAPAAVQRAAATRASDPRATPAADRAGAAAATRLAGRRHRSAPSMELAASRRTGVSGCVPAWTLPAHSRPRAKSESRFWGNLSMRAQLYGRRRRTDRPMTEGRTSPLKFSVIGSCWPLNPGLGRADAPAVPAAPRADKARFRRFSGEVLPSRSSNCPEGRAGAPDSQILRPSTKFSQTRYAAAAAPPRRAHTRTRTRVPRAARRAAPTARRRPPPRALAARRAVRRRAARARPRRARRPPLWPGRRALCQASSPTSGHTSRAAACARATSSIAEAPGVRVRRRPRRRDIAQRPKARRSTCRRPPTPPPVVIRPVMTLCAARRPLSCDERGVEGRDRSTAQSAKSSKSLVSGSGGPAASLIRDGSSGKAGTWNASVWTK